MPFPQDRLTLINILEFTDRVLQHYISQLPPDDKNRFLPAWTSEVRPELRAVIAQLQQIGSSDAESWRSLVRVGLTDASLALKRHYLAAAAQGGWRKRFLDLLNKFLGSLAAGIPGAEPIKELKEWLEGLVEDQPEPDQSLITLFNSGEPMAF